MKLEVKCHVYVLQNKSLVHKYSMLYSECYRSCSVLTVVLCFFLLKLHITIQKGGRFPELKRCSTCCTAYHCPFCRPSLFRPTKLSKVRAHLDSHFNRAVFHAGIVYKCFTVKFNIIIKCINDHHHGFSNFIVVTRDLI